MISEIESDLGIQLPQFYKEAMENYPYVLGEHSKNYLLCNSYEEITKINLTLRDKGFAGSTWPSPYFVIGFDGCGNYYFLDTSEENKTVYFADHERHQLKSDNEKYIFDEYLNYIKEVEREISDDEDYIPPLKKPWWKFW